MTTTVGDDSDNDDSDDDNSDDSDDGDDSEYDYSEGGDSDHDDSQGVDSERRWGAPRTAHGATAAPCRRPQLHYMIRDQRFISTIT